MADVIVPSAQRRGGRLIGPGVQTLLDAVAANGDSDVYVFEEGGQKWFEVTITGTATLTLKGAITGTPATTLGTAFTASSGVKDVWLPAGARIMGSVSGYSSGAVSLVFL